MKVSQSPNPVSQPARIPEPGSEPPATNDKSKKNGQGGAFVIAPLPISSPALGAGIVPLVSYIFPTGTGTRASSASVIGAVGLLTDDGTGALALGGEIYSRRMPIAPPPPIAEEI